MKVSMPSCHILKVNVNHQLRPTSVNLWRPQEREQRRLVVVVAESSDQDPQEGHEHEALVDEAPGSKLDLAQQDHEDTLLPSDRRT